MLVSTEMCHLPCHLFIQGFPKLPDTEGVNASDVDFEAAPHLDAQPSQLLNLAVVNTPHLPSKLTPLMAFGAS